MPSGRRIRVLYRNHERGCQNHRSDARHPLFYGENDEGMGNMREGEDENITSKNGKDGENVAELMKKNIYFLMKCVTLVSTEGDLPKSKLQEVLV